MNDPKQWNETEDEEGERDGDVLFLANIPIQIEASWDSDFAPRLAGFPPNLLYTGIQKANGRSSVEGCCYWFDPGTYAEDSDKREMTYFPRVKSPYRVKVEYHKKGKLWRTLKYRGEELRVDAQGADFDRAMIQTTLVGLKPDEPID